MITGQQFKEKWEGTEGDCLVSFPASTLSDVRLPAEVRVFLVEAGLPQAAAPFLSFRPPEAGTLERVSEAWSQPAGFSRYRIVGSNACGDPVCLDEEENGQVVLLNHDNRFKRVVIALSVFTLAECLLQFRQFIAEVGGTIDPVASERVGELLEQLAGLDPFVREDEGFWQQECRSLQE